MLNERKSRVIVSGILVFALVCGALYQWLLIPECSPAKNGSNPTEVARNPDDRTEKTRSSEWLPERVVIPSTSLIVRVEDVNGQPLTGAKISVSEGCEGLKGWDFDTDEKGEVSVPNADPPCWLAVRKDTFTGRVIAPNDTLWTRLQTDGKTSPPVAIVQLASSETLGITVTTRGPNAPIPGARVTLIRCWADEAMHSLGEETPLVECLSAKAICDGRGYAHVPYAIGEPYAIDVSAPGFASVRHTLAPKESREGAVHIRLHRLLVGGIRIVGTRNDGDVGRYVMSPGWNKEVTLAGLLPRHKRAAIRSDLRERFDDNRIFWIVGMENAHSTEGFARLSATCGAAGSGDVRVEYTLRSPETLSEEDIGVFRIPDETGEVEICFEDMQGRERAPGAQCHLKEKGSNQPVRYYLGDAPTQSLSVVPGTYVLEGSRFGLRRDGSCSIEPDFDSVEFSVSNGEKVSLKIPLNLEAARLDLAVSDVAGRQLCSWFAIAKPLKRADDGKVRGIGSDMYINPTAHGDGAVIDGFMLRPGLYGVLVMAMGYDPFRFEVLLKEGTETSMAAELFRARSNRVLSKSDNLTDLRRGRLAMTSSRPLLEGR